MYGLLLIPANTHFTITTVCIYSNGYKGFVCAALYAEAASLYNRNCIWEGLN